jgi:hypothetical protein
MNSIPQFKAGSLVRADGVGYVITDINRQRVDNKIAYWLAPLREGEGSGRHLRFEEELAPYAEQAWDKEEV